MTLLHFVMAIASAIALAASFPRTNVWPIAWVALVPLFIVYRRSTFRQGFFATAVFGAVFFLTLLYWITLFGYAPWVLLALFQTLFLLLFCLVAGPVFRPGREHLRLLVVPAAWTAAEWLRSLGPFGFTWGSLAHSQTSFLPFIQMASVTGPWAISFAVVTVNVAVSQAISDNCSRIRSAVRLGVLAAAIVVVCVLGRQAMSHDFGNGKKITVAIIQANIDQDMRVSEPWDEHVEETMTGYGSLTMEALGQDPDLVIWPETAIPGYFSQPGNMRWMIEAMARAGNAHMLVGATDVSRSSRKIREYNGAYLFDSSGEFRGSYFKTHLVPFGEFVPGRDWLPFLRRYNVRKYDVAPGGGHYPLKSSIGNTGVMICFESVFPRIARKLVIRGADILVVMTNDAWFKRTSAAEQHYAMSVLRAVENRRYVARAAATGVSGVIEPTGRTRKSAGIFRRSAIIETVTANTEMTFYSRFGDWFAYLCIGVSAAGAMYSIRKSANR